MILHSRHNGRVARLADLLALLVLLAPGFISLLVIQRASGHRSFNDALEKTLASLILSAIANALFLALHGLGDLGAAVEKRLADPLFSLIDLLLLAVWVAVVTALVELDPLSHVVRLFYARSAYVPSRAWEKFMEAHEAKCVMVKTTKDERFLGVLWDFSFEEEERALTRANVQEIRFEADGGSTVLREFDRLHLRAAMVEQVAGVEGGTVSIQPEPIAWRSIGSGAAFLGLSGVWFLSRALLA